MYGIARFAANGSPYGSDISDPCLGTGPRAHAGLPHASDISGPYCPGTAPPAL